jgi:predicted DNA-binding transcriptional regulator AlpA
VNVPASELVDAAGIAKLLGVARSTVYSWIERDASFPKPVVPRAVGSLWAKAHVLEWAERTGKPQRRRSTS